MKISDFSDERISAVLGGDPLSADERSFLVRDTPSFEECGQTEAELSCLSDKELMRTAYDTWADYASGQR